MEYTPKKAPEEQPVNQPLVPDARDKRWIVIVCDFEEEWEGDDEDVHVTTLRPLYALSPKGGGPASVFDEKTWSDRSMALQRANMVQEKLNKSRPSRWEWQVVKLGFVADEKLYWSDGERVDGERVKKRMES